MQKHPVRCQSSSPCLRAKHGLQLPATNGVCPLRVRGGSQERYLTGIHRNLRCCLTCGAMVNEA